MDWFYYRNSLLKPDIIIMTELSATRLAFLMPKLHKAIFRWYHRSQEWIKAYVATVKKKRHTLTERIGGVAKKPHPQLMTIQEDSFEV